MLFVLNDQGVPSVAKFIRLKLPRAATPPDPPLPPELPPADTTPPETSIVSGPSPTTSSNSAGFEFSSSEAGSSFECRLDTGEWADCASPASRSGLSPGPHTFEARPPIRPATPTRLLPPGRGPSSWPTRATRLLPRRRSTPVRALSSASTSATFEFSSSEAGSGFACRLDAGPWLGCASPAEHFGLATGAAYVRGACHRPGRQHRRHRRPHGPGRSRKPPRRPDLE